jgi:hypothetical protein
LNKNLKLNCCIFLIHHKFLKYLRSSIEKLFKLKLETYQVNTEDKEDQEDDDDDKKHRSKVNIDKNIEYVKNSLKYVI